jgi:glycosyltransferase involved in cell wall biosynthesis
MSGSVVWWFKEFLDKVGHDKACLLMHTEPHDPNGPNLEAMLGELELTNGEIIFSRNKVQPDALAAMYNMADCVINVSDAEGFGLATLEALSCETPIIASMTGGLQEQVTDGKEYFGVGIEPASKAIIGSQEVPFIYEDRISKEDFLAALEKMYHMSEEERRELGKKGRAHVVKNYNFKDFKLKWVEVIDRIHKEHGSWDTRKRESTWTLKEVA